MPLAKNVLAPLGLTAAMSAIDGIIQKKIHGSGVKLIIEKEDMNDIIKIIEAFENSGVLLKGVSKTIENETKEQINKLAAELNKPVVKKFNKRKVYSQFKDNIWGVDLADMQTLSKKNKGIKYLLCAIDLFSKYAFVVPLKDKQGASITNAFNKIIKQSNRKPNKILVDQGSEFYNRDFKKWLESNDIIMHSTFNEDKSVVAERFIKTFKK